MAANQFIQVQNGKLVKEGEAYRFIGTNFWSAVNLAVEDPERLLRELDQLKSLGITNLRVMALTEGPATEPFRMVPAIQNYPTNLDEVYLRGLDKFLVECAKHELHVVLCLSNFWPWSGGMAQYISWQNQSSIPYPPPRKGGNWWEYQQYTAAFYQNEQAVSWYHEAIKQLLLRVNSLNGIAYKDDPVIMAWQLANEPRASAQHRKVYLHWIHNSAKLIKTVAPQQLVSLGSEGDTTHPIINGVDVLEDHQSEYIDYVTIHCWVQNWGWFKPEKTESYPQAFKEFKAYLRRQLEKVESLNKPLVLEEFGIARDGGSFDLESSTNLRDRFFKEVFEEIMTLMKSGYQISGANFWAWAGEGRPKFPKCLWEVGDTFTGDPPHEHQGWYSVYDCDQSTLGVIKDYCQKVKAMPQV